MAARSDASIWSSIAAPDASRLHAIFAPRDLARRRRTRAPPCRLDVTIDRVLAPATGEGARAQGTTARRSCSTRPSAGLRRSRRSAISSPMRLLACCPRRGRVLHNASGGLRADLPAGPFNYGCGIRSDALRQSGHVRPPDRPTTQAGVRQPFANHPATHWLFGDSRYGRHVLTVVST